MYSRLHKSKGLIHYESVQKELADLEVSLLDLTLDPPQVKNALTYLRKRKRKLEAELEEYLQMVERTTKKNA